MIKIPIRRAIVRVRDNQPDTIKLIAAYPSPDSVLPLEFQFEAVEGTGFTYVTDMLGLPERDVEIALT